MQNDPNWVKSPKPNGPARPIDFNRNGVSQLIVNDDPMMDEANQVLPSYNKEIISDQIYG